MNDDNQSEADPLGQIADEFVESFRKGLHPSVEEFAQRYPAHADEIREMLPALALMEKANHADEDPATRPPAAAPAGAAHVRQLGDYQILREVGRGGMGVVYEAQQLSLGRHVAIKVLPSHALLDARHLARFQREARSAAKLHHTNIVPVFGVGEQDGLHYYVMQFITGLGLDVVLDELRNLRRPRGKLAPTVGRAPAHATNATEDISAVAVAQALFTGDFRHLEQADTLTMAPGRANLDGQAEVSPVTSARGALTGSSSVRAADPSATVRLPGLTEASTLNDSGSQYWQSVARVGMQVADALAHAASQGILHRDIKPSNLLLDDTGNVWVTDFGLAKADTDGDNLTHTGDIVGTMRYMAPERFNGQGDLRSDTYSLGLTLYELLALRPAFNEADRNKLVKQVMHDEPVRPRKLNPGVPRDLETVILKAIARDPAHRYQTPAEMAADLKRFIEDRPVRARRVSELEKLWRWCRRNPLPASLLAGIVLVFLAGFAGVFTQWRAAETARADEKSQRGRAETLQQGAETARDEANQTRNDAARQAAALLLDKGIEDARGGEPARALHLFVQALRTLPADDPQAPPLERVIRANLSAWAETVPALEQIWSDGPRYSDIAYTPDGEVVAMAVAQDEVQCIQTGTGRPVGPRVKVPAGFGQGSAMVFAPDDRSPWVASTGRGLVPEELALHRFDPSTGRSIQTPIPSPGPVTRLTVTPDGRYLVGAISGLHPEDGNGVADAPRTRRWRTASIVVWEAATGRIARKVEVNAERDITTANVSPDMYLSPSPDGNSVTAWVQRGANRFERMTFSVGGSEPPVRVALPAVVSDVSWKLHFENHMQTGLAIKDNQLHRWSATEPGVLGPGIPTPFRSMLYGPSADGRSVVSPIEGRVFDTGAWPPRPSGVRFAHPGWQKEWVEQSPDGRFSLTWDWDVGGGWGAGRLWRLPSPHSRPVLPPAEFARQPERKLDYHYASLDPRGTRALLWSHHRGILHRASDESKNVRIVDVMNEAVREMTVHHSALVREAVFSADGRYFASASFDGTARVWESATGRPAGPVLQHSNYVATVAFSPDGTTLAAGDYGPAGLVKLWDWRTGKEVCPPLRHDDIVLSVSFSPDGRYLAAVKSIDWSRNPEFLVWDVASGKAVIQVRHHCPGYLSRESARFRPDGRAVATRDVNGVLRLWEVPSGTPLGERPLDGDGVTRFSPDGKVVAASGNLGVRLLDSKTLSPLPAGYLRHAEPIQDVAFSPDGRSLLVGYESGSAQLWDVPTRKPVGPPAVLLGAIRAVTFTPDGLTCVCLSADGTVRRWPVPVPFAEPDLARLADRVTLMTGQRMDDNQGLDSEPAAEWRSLRAKLVGEASTALIAPRRDADWHDAVAADAEQDGDAFGAEWHLDRLASVRPNDWTIAARRGRVLAAVGRREEAAAAYAAARRLAPSPQVLSDWLRAAATEDEAADHKEAALWNLDRAIALTPDDWTLYALRVNLVDSARAIANEDEAIRHGAESAFMVQAAERAAGFGDWKRAATLLGSLAGNPDVPTQTRYLQAVACLKAGDAAGYRAACAGIAKRIPPVGPELSVSEAINGATVFTLAPSATDDWTGPLAWSEHALARLRAFEKAHPEKKDALRQEQHQLLSTRGAVLFRAGRFGEAVKVIGEALAYHPQGGDFDNWVFIALAEHQLGHTGAAKDAVTRARAAQAGSRANTVWDRAEEELLAAELGATLQAPGK